MRFSLCIYDYRELFRKKVSICEIRPLIKNTTLGTSFYDLKKGLKRLGISSIVLQAENDKKVFDEVKYPLITQIQGEDGIHFVTIFEKKGRQLIVGDSSKVKSTKISIEKFMENWLPYILEIDLEKSKLSYNIQQNSKEVSISKIFKILKWHLLLSFLLSIGIYIIGVVIASLYALYFNVLIPQNLGDLALELMLVYIFINAVNFTLSFANNFLYNIMSKKIDEQIIDKYFRGILNKPNMAIESYEIGELLTNLSNIIMIRQRFLTYLQMIPISLLTMGSSFYLLYTSEEKLSIFVLILIILLSLIIYLADNRYKKLSKNLIKTEQIFNESVINTFKNISVIKQFSLENEFSNRGIFNLINYIGDRNKLLNFDAVQSQLKMFILSSFNIILFSTGVYLITKNQLSSGILLTFNALLAYVTNPILNLANLQATMVQGKVAQDKLYNTIESQILLFGENNLKVSNDNTIISFENVSFDYEMNSKILNDLSINIDGKNIAISGLNGTGKSTIGKLISRLYIPDEGTIKINNQNLLDISNQSISENIVYIDGRENLFSSTISDNIKLGREIEDEEIISILNSIEVNSAFMSKDFEVIKDTQLSLGQMQIVKILRSTIIPKKIYIFDEITNGLDENMKKSVMQYLIDLPGMKFFITHDKEVIECCEQEYTVSDMNMYRKR